MAAILTTTAPSGVVYPFAGVNAPDGFLFCYGQAISRSTYASLFSALSTSYGAGDGSTTFNIPDLRGRLPAGKDNMGGSAASRLTSGGSGVDGVTLGASGGAQTHTLTTGQMASHSHFVTTRTTVDGDSVGYLASSDNTGNPQSVTSGAAGSDQAHNNTQPTLILNYIIKV